MAHLQEDTKNIQEGINVLITFVSNRSNQATGSGASGSSNSSPQSVDI